VDEATSEPTSESIPVNPDPLPPTDVPDPTLEPDSESSNESVTEAAAAATRAAGASAVDKQDRLDLDLGAELEITAASGDGNLATYRVSDTSNRAFHVGDLVTIVGLKNRDFNVVNARIVAVSDSGFTIENPVLDKEENATAKASF